MRAYWLRIAAFASLVPGLRGCVHIGPGALVDDRLQYNCAVATSWKQQTLLNLVRMRYAETPEFIDIPSIVNGYSLDHGTTGSFGFENFPKDTIANNLTWGLGFNRTVGDRPTVAYTPQSGAEFIRNLVNPIPPSMILALLEGGIPADAIFGVAVDSINGIRNRQLFGGEVLPADPEFQRITQIIRSAQEEGSLSFRVRTEKDKKDGEVVLLIQERDIAPERAADIAALRRLLKLNPQTSEFRIVFGSLAKDGNEIAVRTRSAARILNHLALYVEAPTAHLASGIAPDRHDPMPPEHPPLRVRCGCEKPECCYTAVQFHCCWFWIDQCDTSSKLTFQFLKVLFALADTSTKEAPPVLTIRAN